MCTINFEYSYQIFTACIVLPPEPMNQLLNEGDALDCTAAVMKHHINSPRKSSPKRVCCAMYIYIYVTANSLACTYLIFCTAIQRKGCLVVRLLSSAEHLTSQPLCVSLASVVVGALAQWRTEPEVEVEVGWLSVVCLLISRSVRQSVDPLVGRSVGRSVHPSVRPSVGRSVGLSVSPSVSRSVRQSVGPLVCQSVRPSVRPSVCLSTVCVLIRCNNLPFTLTHALLIHSPTQALVCAHKLCMCSEQMARALVMRDMHLLLFNMLYHIQDSRGTSSEQESLLERGSRESSAVSSLPGEEGGVESERDCESYQYLEG